MWKKIKEILCKHNVCKDETNIMADISSSSDQPEHLIPKSLATNLLNKTDEHRRSLFNLFPTSLRPRPRSKPKGIDASTSTERSALTYMSETLLNRTSSVSSYHAPIRSIENLLQGHSKGNPTAVKVLVRKNFEPFAQAHASVTKGMIVTALFARGPWLFVRIDSTGKTGYIPRLICSLDTHDHLQGTSIKNDDFLSKQDPCYKSTRSICSIITSVQSEHSKRRRMMNIPFDERDRRNTYTLPRPPRLYGFFSKDRRSTMNTLSVSNPDNIDIDPCSLSIPTRDTDSSSTQDSGYSESASFYLDTESSPKKKLNVPPHYATVRRPVLLRVPNSTVSLSTDNPSRPSLTQESSPRRLPEFALIRSVRRDPMKLSLNNLPKSDIQIPASIILTHHRQKHQFPSDQSAFRPIEPKKKTKRASSEGHSPSTSPSSSSSSSNGSLNILESPTKKVRGRRRRHLSCDFPMPLPSSYLTRSVYESQSTSSPKKAQGFSRTMSDILCDQFSELNLDAIEKDSLIHPTKTKKKSNHSRIFTIRKDYRSARGTFAVERGETVQLLKQVGRACVLIRRQTNGQIGFLPKTYLGPPSTSSRIETFLEMHGYRETVI